MEKTWIIVLTDPGSVDPDDWLALLMLQEALKDHPDWHILCITGHFRSATRARLTAHMFDHPRFHITYNQGPTCEEDFARQNSAWPEIFGTPFSATKPWFPKFGAAFEGLPVVNKSARVSVDDVFAMADRVFICAISPIIDAIEAIPQKYYSRAIWFAMGGAQANGTAGYNWGISPESTQNFQANLMAARTYVTCVTSAMGRECLFPLELYEKWAAQATTPRQTALIAEWINSNRGNKLAAHKNMCDPLAVWVMMQSILGAPVPISDRGAYQFEQGKDYLASKMHWVSGEVVRLPAIDYEKARADILALLCRGFGVL